MGDQVFCEPGEMRKSSILSGDIFKNCDGGELSTRALYSPGKRDIWFGNKACLWELNHPFRLRGQYVDLQSAWSAQRRINVAKLKIRFVANRDEVTETS